MTFDCRDLKGRWLRPFLFVKLYNVCGIMGWIGVDYYNEQSKTNLHCR